MGLLEVLPQQMNHRPPAFCGRSDLETLFASDSPQVSAGVRGWLSPCAQGLHAMVLTCTRGLAAVATEGLPALALPSKRSYGPTFPAGFGIRARRQHSCENHGCGDEG